MRTRKGVEEIGGGVSSFVGHPLHEMKTLRFPHSFLRLLSMSTL